MFPVRSKGGRKNTGRKGRGLPQEFRVNCLTPSISWCEGMIPAWGAADWHCRLFCELTGCSPAGLSQTELPEMASPRCLPGRGKGHLRNRRPGDVLSLFSSTKQKPERPGGGKRPLHDGSGQHHYVQQKKNNHSGQPLSGLVRRTSAS